MRKYFGVIGIWLFVPLAIVVLPFAAPGLTCLAMLYLFLGGACLSVVFFVLFFLTRKKPQAAAALFLVAGIWLLSLWDGFAFGARIHLLVNEGRYAEKIREISRAKSTEEKQRVCGDDCLVRSEVPIVTFHYCHCIFYWPDIVYDPSGALAVNRDELKKLDLDLHDSRHLTTFWYIGYFGD
jgi:hypothetical protein